MKTLAAMNPINSVLNKDAVDELLIQQHEMQKLIDQAHNKNLSKIRASISISKFLKLKLGDTMRVVIYHNQRHLKQIKRVVSFAKNKT